MLTIVRRRMPPSALWVNSNFDDVNQCVVYLNNIYFSDEFLLTILLQNATAMSTLKLK